MIGRGIVNWKKDAQYRLRLAQGFYEEAEENLGYKQYRSCVDNSQLCIENCAKAIIVCFIPLGKTHSPAQGLKRLLQEKKLAGEVKKDIGEIIPMVEEHGFEEHVLSDYGDEGTYRTPWEIFDKRSAEDTFKAATKVFRETKRIISLIYESYGSKRGNDD